jgi:hypothetical protein
MGVFRGRRKPFVNEPWMILKLYNFYTMIIDDSFSTAIIWFNEFVSRRLA